MRRWRNWQTHQLEVLAPRGIGVQVPSSAPRILLTRRPGRAGKKLRKIHILLYVVVVLHVIVCLFLIGVVLLQQGRSADLAGAFGGQGSQTAFGPRAAANVLTRLTTWAAIIFMLTSLSLTVLYVRNTGSHSVLEGAKPAPASAPAKSGK